MGFTSPPDKRDVDKLTQEFLAESFEGLDRMDRCLTELESRPGDTELVGEVFRALHTIKGTTGFLGFKRVETLAHAGEKRHRSRAQREAEGLDRSGERVC